MRDSSTPLSRSATAGGLPVAPSLSPALAEAHVSSRRRPYDGRAFYITALSLVVACLAALAARFLSRLIDLFTNVAYFGELTLTPRGPASHSLGAWAALVPMVGGLIVGIMARYGSSAIRGHGIPEAMERVLEHESRIPLRMTFLKPLSAAVAIGSGGPFGAEGPIIATGGALGSMFGQFFSTASKERKTLLAAGAAAGMAATFGTPVAAVLLAIELLLFELSPRSLVPVSLAVCVATALRISWAGTAPVFAMPACEAPLPSALAAYVLIGIVLGFSSVLVTRLVYGIEELFEKLPLHFMWWPALGGLAVGLVGLFDRRVLGVGYDNIEHIVQGQLVLTTLVTLFVLKLVAWSISLGSGTSGGTLAPLFTIGGALGASLGALATSLAPHAGIDLRVAGLVGMAAMFAGASRALLASVVFAFETTRQPNALLPLLAGCAAAYLVSCALMRHSIMTRKIAARGIHVPHDYVHDLLERVSVGRCATRALVTLEADSTVESARTFLRSEAQGSRHQGYPVVDRAGLLVGVLTRRELLADTSEAEKPLRALLQRKPQVVFEDSPLSEAVELMLREDVGRLPVVRRAAPSLPVGILTRSDILRAHAVRFDETRPKPARAVPWPRRA